MEEVFELFEPRKATIPEHFFRHINTLEQFMKLLRTAAGVPGTTEARQMFADLLEGNTVTAIVRAGRAKREFATVEGFGDDLGDFADTVIVAGIADVESLIVDRFTRCLENPADGLADVQAMHEWPPGGAIAGHANFASGPSQAGKVVEHDVKTHVRGRTIGRGVSQENGTERVRGQWADIVFDADFTDGVGSLRIHAGLLVHKFGGGHTVHAARGHINEPLDPGLAGQLRQMDGTFVIDFISDIGRQLTKRVVGQFAQMHDGFEAVEIFDPDLANVFGKGSRRYSRRPIQGSFTIESSIEPGDIMPIA